MHMVRVRVAHNDLVKVHAVTIQPGCNVQELLVTLSRQHSTVLKECNTSTYELIRIIGINISVITVSLCEVE